MRPITPKQKEFAERIAKGEDPIALVKELYFDKKLTPEGFRKWAQTVINKPQVKRQIVKTYDAMAEVGLNVKSAALKTLVIMNRPRGRDRDKLAAAELVFKYHDKANEGKSVVSNPLILLIQQRIDRGLGVPDDVKQAFEAIAIQNTPVEEKEEDEPVVKDESEK